MTRDIFLAKKLHPTDGFSPTHLRDLRIKSELLRLKCNIVDTFKQYPHLSAIKKSSGEIKQFLEYHWINKVQMIPESECTNVFLECNERLSVERKEAVKCFYATRDVDDVFLLMSGEHGTCIGCIAYGNGYIFVIRNDLNDLEEEVKDDGLDMRMNMGMSMNMSMDMNLGEAQHFTMDGYDGNLGLRGGHYTNCDNCDNSDNSEYLTYNENYLHFKNVKYPFRCKWSIDLHTFNNGIKKRELNEYPKDWDYGRWFWVDHDITSIRELPVRESDCMDTQRDILFSFHLEEISRAYFKEVRIRQKKIIIKHTPFLLKEGLIGVNWSSVKDENQFFTSHEVLNVEQHHKKISSFGNVAKLLTENPFLLPSYQTPESPHFTISTDVIITPFAFTFCGLSEDYVYMLGKIIEKNTFRHLRFALFLLNKHDNYPTWIEIDSTISKYLPSNILNIEVAIAPHPINRILYLCHISRSRSHVILYSFNIEYERKWKFERSFAVKTTYPKKNLDLYIYNCATVIRFEEKGITRAVYACPCFPYEEFHHNLFMENNFSDMEIQISS